MQDTHKESKYILSNEIQQIQEKSFLQSYKNYSGNFHKQVEKAITQRNELVGRVYLEYLKYYKQIVDKMFEYQNNFVAKIGLKVETSEWYNEIFRKFYESTSTLYSNQAKIAEPHLT